ncbi:MAG TPA: hypothetical protein DHV62_08710 [Elusimicrobia bacterium]|nr:hypothetical protein [Elusimicrobiota bacterium]
MKKEKLILGFVWFLIFFVSLFSVRIVYAQFGDLWGELKTEIEGKSEEIVKTEYLEPLAKDVGSIIGGGSFHTGKSCGFPGFDIGGHLPMISKPSKENKILPAEQMYGLPWVQAEIALPVPSYDLILRGFYLGESGGGIFGIGVRYSLLSGVVPLTPAVSLSVLANQLKHEKLNVYNFTLNSVVSIGLPAITPYLGLGIDSTTVQERVLPEHLEATASGWRLIGGVNLKLVPTTYLHIGIGSYNGIFGGEVGVGINF